MGFRRIDQRMTLQRVYRYLRGLPGLAARMALRPRSAGDARPACAAVAVAVVLATRARAAAGTRLAGVAGVGRRRREAHFLHIRLSGHIDGDVALRVGGVAAASGGPAC